MRKDSLFSGLVCAALMGGIVAQHALPRLKYAHPKPLPIDSFPRVEGQWVSGADVPVDPVIQQAIPTAKLLQRIYRNPSGKEIFLCLITGPSYADFHDPNVCFPAHGYTLSKETAWNQDGQQIRFITAERNGAKQDFMYFFPGGFALGSRMGLAYLEKMYALRRLITGEQGGSLVVRLTADDSPTSVAMLKSFIHQIMPDVNALVAKGKSK